MTCIIFVVVVVVVVVGYDDVGPHCRHPEEIVVFEVDGNDDGVVKFFQIEENVLANALIAETETKLQGNKPVPVSYVHSHEKRYEG